MASLQKGNKIHQFPKTYTYQKMLKKVSCWIMSGMGSEDKFTYRLFTGTLLYYYVSLSFISLLHFTTPLFYLCIYISQLSIRTTLSRFYRTDWSKSYLYLMLLLTSINIVVTSNYDISRAGPQGDKLLDCHVQFRDDEITWCPCENSFCGWYC